MATPLSASSLNDVDGNESDVQEIDKNNANHLDTEFESTCRICSSKDEDCVPLFEPYHSKRYDELVKTYTGLEITQNDKLPFKICRLCLSELDIVIKFVSKVRLSIEKFDKYLKKIVDDKYLEDDEEKIPLSILGASLKKELFEGDSDGDHSIEEPIFEECGDINDEEKDVSVKQEPDVITLDSLKNILSNKGGDECLYVTVNNLTIKKEGVKREKPLSPGLEIELKPDVSIKPVKLKKNKVKVKKKHKKEKLKLDIDSKYSVLKASEHGLLKDMVKCLICGHVMHNRSAFIVHYRRHIGDRPFKCRQCSKSFLLLGALNEHVRSVHLGLKRRKPKEKEPTEPDPDENVKFKILKADEYGLRKDKVQCLECKLICENKSAFVTHFRKHSGEKPFRCEHCDKCFPRLGSLNDHIKKMHDPDKPNGGEDESNDLYVVVKAKDNPTVNKDMVQCQICKSLFNDKSAFRIHYRKHTGDNPFKCDQCTMVFRRMMDLKEHVKKIHEKRVSHYTPRQGSGGQESCICYACGKSFKHKSSLTIHIRTHTDEKPHECSYCGKRFIRSQELSLHIRIHHTGEKPYSCHLCGKTFAAGTQLKSHMFVHTDEKNFNCHVCNTFVKTRDSLAKHMRVMHSTRKNICDICGAAFAFRYGLRDHMKNRHSDRSELCDICKKPFSDLARHMITHSDQKPFGCQMCQKGFFRQKSLKAHMVKHHNDPSLSYM